MNQMLVLMTYWFTFALATSHFDPLQYLRKKQHPITPYNGFLYLKYRPLTDQLRVHTIKWLKDVNKITPLEIKKLKSSIVKHGVVKIPNQNLTRKQQVVLSEKLGEPVVLPESLHDPDYDIKYPSIIPFSNYWTTNGTWKGKKHIPGRYWHQDGNYFPHDKAYIFSLLYADQYDEDIIGGETAFINSCHLRWKIPSDIEQYLKNVVISLSARDIPDFRRRGSVEDLNQFPQAYHRAISKHPEKDDECIILQITDDMRNRTDPQTMSVFRLWDYMQNPNYVEIQKWKTGDIVIWDNFGTFHRAMPFVNIEKKRILYRILIRQKIKN